MRIVKAWVQVEIEVEEADILPGNQKLKSFIAEAVEDGSADVRDVYYAWHQKVEKPEVKCACGETVLTDLDELCLACLHKKDELFHADHLQRGRDVAAEVEVA